MLGNYFHYVNHKEEEDPTNPARQAVQWNGRPTSLARITS